MTRSIDNRGLLRPFEIERLTRVLLSACTQRGIDPDSEGARDLALNLLALHNAGMTDEDMLVNAVAFALPDRATA